MAILNAMRREMIEAAERQREAEAARLAKHGKQGASRPPIDPADIAPYLNWIAQGMAANDFANHLKLAELAIRSKANEAQGKATQHTLVEEGIIDQPGA